MAADVSVPRRAIQLKKAATNRRNTDGRSRLEGRKLFGILKSEPSIAP
jgi:hypothetical protein